MFRVTCAALALVIAGEVIAAPSGFIERRRMDRVDTAEERYSSPESITLNIHYRVPVVETLGYLAAFDADTQKLTLVASELRPIAARVQDLTGDSFEGREFPPEIDAECQRLRTEMFAHVRDIYGAEMVTRIDRYLKLKYDKLTGGVFSSILD